MTEAPEHRRGTWTGVSTGGALVCALVAGGACGGLWVKFAGAFLVERYGAIVTWCVLPEALALLLACALFLLDFSARPLARALKGGLFIALFVVAFWAPFNALILLAKFGML